MIPIFYISDQHTVAKSVCCLLRYKVLLEHAVPIHSYGCGCFCTTMTELSILRSLKCVLPDSTKIAPKSLIYKVYSNFYVHFISAIFIGTS